MNKGQWVLLNTLFDIDIEKINLRYYPNGVKFKQKSVRVLLIKVLRSKRNGGRVPQSQKHH